MPVIVCFLICTWLNLFYFNQHILFDDEHRFLEEAMGIAHNLTFGTGSARAWEMPGTAILYAPLIFIAGSAAPFFIRLIQAIVCAYQVWLIRDLATAIYNVRAGRIAAWIAALYPFFLFYQGLMLSEALFTCGLIAAYRLMYRGKSNIWAFALLTYIKPTLLIFPVFLQRNIVIRLIVFALIMSPWVLRNELVLGYPVLFTTGASINLYLGNNPKATGGISYKNDIDRTEVDAINALPELKRDQAFKQIAIETITENRTGFMRRAWIKFKRFWNIIPNAEEYGGIYAWIAALSFGPVLLLAVWSAVKHWRNWRIMLPIYMLIAYMTGIHLITIASLRYRLPIEPFLIVMASGAFNEKRS